MSGKKERDSLRGQTDWARLDRLTDDEIEAMALADDDNPARTEDEWASAVAFVPPRKTVINARFDSDVVEWFKSQGPGYQPRMNSVLRRYMEAQTRARKTR